jgi:glutamate decarboxylase
MTMAQADLSEQLEALAREYGNRFLLEPAPDNQLPEHGMRAVDAMRLIGEELVLDGLPMRNLATFVTTWMEPEAQRVIAENLYRNFIDHAEYPQTAEIEQRCIRMLADLFHAPGETTGARTQGSSEAIMLGALSLKWKWRARREQAGKDTTRPNLVFGGDVHVVWEKFCRYFDVEPKDHPAAARQVHDRARGRRAARRREHDRRRRGARDDVHRSRRRHRWHQPIPAGPQEGAWTRRAAAR